MQYRRLGRTDLVVSEVGIGCARLGGVFHGGTRAELLRILLEAVHHGVTFFDTADLYTQGESEALLGEAFQKRRQDVVIASKVGYCLPARGQNLARLKPLLKPLVRRLGIRRASVPAAFKGTMHQDFSPRYIVNAVEKSLQRLRTDYLDLYQLHSPPRQVLASGDFLAPLEKLKSQGKIRYYGVSCEAPDDALLCLKYPEISTVQIGVSLLHQEALATIVPLATRAGLGLIARQCFASGLLAKAPALQDGESSFDQPGQQAVAQYAELAALAGRPLAQLALKFALAVEGVSATLLGIRTHTHLEDNIRHLTSGNLTDQELRLLRAAGAALPTGREAECATTGADRGRV